MSRPWLKFFPSDWRGDPRLRLCSLAARGLWIDLICYMHEGTPYGHLTIDGAPPSREAIAALLGRSPREVGKALDELAARRVFDRGPNDAIVSRRMVRDEARAEVGREHATRQWRSSAQSRKPDGAPSGSPTGSDSGSGGGSPSGEPSTQTPDSRIQIPDRENARDTRALSLEEFDEQVWKPYPRTPVMSKEQAWRAWRKAPAEDRAAIVAAIPRYAAWLRRQKPDYPVLNVETFIAQRRFAGFAEADSAPAPRGFHAAAESPQLAAWDAHSRATRGRGLPRDRDGGWRVETEWPPGHAPGANTAKAPNDEEAA